MTRFWGHAFAAVGVLALAVELIPACAHNDSSIFINGVLAPAVAGAANGQACTFTADPTQLHLGSGLMDVSLTGSYYAELLVGNQLLPRASPEQGRTETSRVVLQGAIITATDIQGHNLHDPFTRSASGTIDPSQGTTPGYIAINVQLVDRSITDSIASGLTLGGDATRILVHVKMFGNTLGGDHVETNDFQFPIDICRGCLIEYNNISPITMQCAQATAGGGGGTQFFPCIFGQDQPVSCSLCLSHPDCVTPPSGVFIPSADAGADSSVSDASGGG